MFLRAAQSLRSPFNLRIESSLDSSTNTLTWDAVPGATSYEIQTSPNGNFLAAKIISLSEPAYSHDTGKTTNRVWYRVRAVSGAAKSTWTIPLDVITGSGTTVYDGFSFRGGRKGWNQVRGI